MPKVAVLAKMTAKEGQGPVLLEALSGMIEAVGGEAGTEIYALHSDAASADVVWFYELYSDKDALGILYDASYDQVYRMLFHRTLDTAFTEDLISDVYMKVMKGIRKFQ